MPRAIVGVAGRPAIAGPNSNPFTQETPVSDQATGASDLQQKYRQFLDLLPLTISLSGLPTSEGRLYSEEQLEARAITVRLAYKVARNLARECLGGS